MPYIKPERRTDLDPLIEALEDPVMEMGELNYCINELLWRFFVTKTGTNYGGINAMIGVMECSKLEFYRRVAGAMEDIKLAQNGEVFLGLEDLRKIWMGMKPLPVPTGNGS